MHQQYPYWAVGVLSIPVSGSVLGSTKNGPQDLLQLYHWTRATSWVDLLALPDSLQGGGQMGWVSKDASRCNHFILLYGKAVPGWRHVCYSIAFQQQLSPVILLPAWFWRCFNGKHDPGILCMGRRKDSWRRTVEIRRTISSEHFFLKH